ncbi:DMT family transporter [Lentibacillus halophilus]|uniref:DMT family transporter n=1 Tax=Lentibacillus halophilus TaxID=295065 RepID=A0ABN0ZGQ6_9BACI
MNKKAMVMAFITIVIWGSSFAGIRASLHGGYSSGHLVLVRFLIASGAFVLYALWPRTRFRLPAKQDVLKILVLGWIGITIYHTGITFGEQTVTAGTTAMIVASAPIFTAIIAVFALKEYPSLFSWIGLGIGFIGIFLITVGSADAAFAISGGALLIVVSAIATSAFFVFQKTLLPKYRPVELTAYFTWAGTLPLLIFSPGLLETVQSATLEAHFAALYVGIFPAAIGYVTWAIALSSGKAGAVTSMMYIEPVFAILIAWVWLQELPSLLSIIGGLIALSSVILVNMFERRRRRAG